MNENKEAKKLNKSRYNLKNTKKEKQRIIQIKMKNIFKKNKYSKFKLIKCIIPIIIILLSVIISLSLIFTLKKHKILNISPSNLFKNKLNKPVIQIPQNFSSLHESFNKAKYFLDKCLKGIMMNNQTLKLSDNPKVSAIIPAHNCERTISRAIKSVQNQDILNIEIIIVNDYSNDNTLSLIEEAAKIDPRIRIINNKKNMGIFYNRHIGVLSSKGEYIFHLDSDDMILDSDVFSTVTNIGDMGNFDLVTFRCVFAMHSFNLLNAGIKENYFSDYPRNLTLYQPELGLFSFRPGKEYGKYVLIESYIWVTCVKTSVYQKVSQKIGEARYTRYQIYEEDRTDIYALRTTAQSMRFIGKYGYLKIQTPSSMTWTIKEKEDFIGRLYFLDINIDFSHDTFESKKVLVYYFTNMMEHKGFEKVIKTSEYHRKIFISCVNKLLNSKYVAKEDKDEIKRRVSKYDFLKS